MERAAETEGGGSINQRFDVGRATALHSESEPVRRGADARELGTKPQLLLFGLRGNTSQAQTSFRAAAGG